MVDSDRFSRRRLRLLSTLLTVTLLVLIPVQVIPVVAGLPLLAGLAAVGCLNYRRTRLPRYDVTAPPSSHASELRFRSMLERLPKVAIQGYDKERRVVYWNDASTRLYGFTPDEAIGSLLEDLLIPETLREAVITGHRAWIEQGLGIPPGELELKHRNGGRVAVFSYHVMLGERSDNPLMFCIDIERRALQHARREFDLVSGFDVLNHLPNQPAFETELARCLVDCQRQGHSVALVRLGIEPRNDASRHAEFDLDVAHEEFLMAMVAHRLSQGQRMTRMARFGGEGLVMALSHLPCEDDVLPLIEGIFDDLAAPFLLGRHEVTLTVSLGISLFPSDGVTSAELMHKADAAKQRSALAGINSYCFFDQSLHDELTRQQQLMERLRHGLRVGEFMLCYEPRVAVTGNRIEDLDVSLKWMSREGATLTPLDFLPATERHELIRRLGDWVMREACHQHSQWKVTDSGGYRLDISLPEGHVHRETLLEPLETYMAATRQKPSSAVRQRRAEGDRAYGLRIEALPAARHDVSA